MSNVLQLFNHDKFTVERLNGLLPLVNRITKVAQSEVSRLLDHENKHEERINEIVETWQAKMKALGAETKGLWIADFDSGTDYFCWKYPESEVTHRHAYNEGFRYRTKLSK